MAAVLAQLTATLAAGLLAEAIGLRATAWLAPLGGLLGALILWASPVRTLMVRQPDARGKGFREGRFGGQMYSSSALLTST